MESANDELRELTLLENIENDPDVNQSTLATQLGVAVPDGDPARLITTVATERKRSGNNVSGQFDGRVGVMVDRNADCSSRCQRC